VLGNRAAVTTAPGAKRPRRDDGTRGRSASSGDGDLAAVLRIGVRPLVVMRPVTADLRAVVVVWCYHYRWVVQVWIRSR
jgi:hypothetical protein